MPTALEEDIRDVSDVKYIKQTGLHLFDSKDMAIGKIFFSLKDIPPHQRFLTTRKNTVERISDGEVLVFSGVVEDHHILKDGYIYRNQQGSFWIWRKTLNWCVLFEDKIAFYPDPKAFTDGSAPLLQISLVETTGVEVSKQEPNSVDIKFDQGNSTCYLIALTPGDRDHWAKLISYAKTRRSIPIKRESLFSNRSSEEPNDESSEHEIAQPEPQETKAPQAPIEKVDKPFEPKSETIEVEDSDTSITFPPSRTGNKLGTYLIGKRIGSGTFGEVYFASTENGISIAVKSLLITQLLTPEQRDTLAHDIDHLKEVVDPNVISYDELFVSDNGEIDIVMESVDNESVAELLKKNGKLKESQIAKYTLQALQGLAYLHEKEVIHGDVKCSNMLLTKDGTLKLSDYNFSFLLFGTNSRVESRIKHNTANWMAPEVIEAGDYWKQSDIWSLGCSILEMLWGKPVFSEIDNEKVLKSMVEVEHPPIPYGISSDLEEFLNFCFRKDPSRRVSAKHLLEHSFVASVKSEIELPKRDEFQNAILQKIPSKKKHTESVSRDFHTKIEEPIQWLLKAIAEKNQKAAHSVYLFLRDQAKQFKDKIDAKNFKDLNAAFDKYKAEMQTTNDEQEQEYVTYSSSDSNEDDDEDDYDDDDDRDHDTHDDDKFAF